MSTTRRSALRSISALGAATFLKTKGLAAPSRDNAIVAIHLIGGNDSNNMIVPTDAEYGTYARARGELAIPRSALLNISTPGQSGSFGLHPNMGELRRLYDQGAVGVVANVGSRSPESLSHSDNKRWSYVRPGYVAPPWIESLQQPVTEEHPRDVYGFSSGLLAIPAERAGIEGTEIDNKKLIEGMKNARPLGTQFPRTGLGLQLEQVAKLLQIGEGMRLSRPVFSVTLSGFDTHANQLPKHAELLETLSGAMAAFHEALRELGISDRVTAYTDTEFNRALVPNRSHGSDHGWGGHNLVMGASVRGGDIHGVMPSLEVGGKNDAGGNGVWRPAIYAQDFEASMAHRYGLAEHEIHRTLPDASNSTAF